MIKKINSLYFLADTKEDLKTLPAEMGAECYVIKEACEFKCTSDGEWISQKVTTTTGGSNVDLTGYATEDYVQSAISAIEFPEADLSNYATKEEIPSIDGLASESFVESAIKEASHLDKDYGKEHMFGLMVKATENRTLVEAMLAEGKGMYNFHVQKGTPGQPAEVVEKNSSCRGICCVDTYRSDDNWYGWILMFDHDGEVYVQYIRDAEPKGWKHLMTVES